MDNVSFFNRPTLEPGDSFSTEDVFGSNIAFDNLLEMADQWAASLMTDRDFYPKMKKCGMFINATLNAGVVLMNTANKAGKPVPSDLSFYDGMIKYKSKANLPVVKLAGHSIPGISITAAKVLFELIKAHPLSSALSDEQIFGILANLAHESSFDPTLMEGDYSRLWSGTPLKQNSKPAFGIAQFTYTEAALAIENIMTSWSKLNDRNISTALLAGAMCNPIFQVDHLLRTIFNNHHVTRAQHGFNNKSLSNNGFFKKGQSASDYSKSFMLGYERPKDKTGANVAARGAAASQLIKLL